MRGTAWNKHCLADVGGSANTAFTAAAGATTSVPTPVCLFSVTLFGCCGDLGQFAVARAFKTKSGCRGEYQVDMLFAARWW
jgi:hypothetical protein